jgi:hypothetical protein
MKTKLLVFILLAASILLPAQKSVVLPTSATVSISFVGDKEGDLVEPDGWYRCSDGKELGWCPPAPSAPFSEKMIRNYIEQKCNFELWPNDEEQRSNNVRLALFSSSHLHVFEFTVKLSKS